MNGETFVTAQYRVCWLWCNYCI